MNLDIIKQDRKLGEEFLSIEGKNLPIKLMDFWSWSSYNILSNALRGVFAEFIVACALGVTNKPRIEWDAYDLITDEGIKIEVKSSAYIQSWKQAKHSEINFNISPTKAWNSKTNEYSEEYKRQADVYVFCLLAHKDKETVDPLNLSQWDFFILNTSLIDEKIPFQKSIGLNSLLKLNPKKVKFNEIKNAIKTTVSLMDNK